jgi:hypothetical protein
LKTQPELFAAAAPLDLGPLAEFDSQLAEFKMLDEELAFARRLYAHGAQVFAGTTDVFTRKLRARIAISSHCLEATQTGIDPAKVETYTQAFERIYGEPLVPKPPTRRSARKAE